MTREEDEALTRLAEAIARILAAGWRRQAQQDPDGVRLAAGPSGSRAGAESKDPVLRSA